MSIDNLVNSPLFVSAVLAYSASCRVAREELDIFLQIGNYDFHQMQRIKGLRNACLGREEIADHYYAGQEAVRGPVERTER